MLGRLLHLGSGGSTTTQAQAQNSASRPILSLESVQEDVHTRNLLFPDAEALYQHRNDQVFPLSSAHDTPPSTSAVNTFDYSEEVDLDVRDVRVLIMQDALGPANASLLFDSHQPPDAIVSERSTSAKDTRKPPTTSSRKSSQSQSSRPVIIQTDSPQPRQGAFDRRASMHGRSQSTTETDSQRQVREYREELATFSSCIFGNSELMAYKGTSTKVHMVPSDSRTSESMNSSFGDGRSSIGRSSARSSKLSQSYSSQAISPTHLPSIPSASGGPGRQHDKKKVLITRLFPVNLVPEASESETTSQSRFSDDNSSFPFPATGDDSTPKKRKPQPKQRRTPMYAVVLVVQVPAATSRVTSAMPPKSAFRESGSYNDGDFFPSSYSSTTQASGWNLSRSGTYGEASDMSYSMDVEDRIDSLTQHWDIIMRTLTHLQSLVATVLHRMLRQVDAASPGPQPAGRVSRTPSVTERRSSDLQRPKPPKSTIKLVSLTPNCLADEYKIASEVGLARTRIVMGLSAARVITGQGRWSVWRDEAVWTSKWAASMGQDSFFYNLLTGFLATHTDWMQALCGPEYRRLALKNRRDRDEEDMSLPARTIIVSDDKMAARRMIFLLAAFLPSNQQIPAARAHRPSMSNSFGTISNSPPTYIIPVLREESLRRKINRRSGLRRASHSRAASQSLKPSPVPPQLAHMNMDRNHQRRASDAASIRTLNLPMPGNDLVSRKSSAATTATIVPETTTPHFSGIQRGEGDRRRRPESSDSVAADDLMRSLKRGESSGRGSMSGPRPTSQGLKWGTLVSGLWSPRRRDSVETTTYKQTSDLRSPVKMTFSRTDMLSAMVQEANPASTADGEPEPHSIPRAAHPRDFGTPRQSTDRHRGSFAQADRTPDPTGAFESPVKTSINDDGVIDVDVPFPDYMASFESAISSPSSSGYLSTPALPSGMDSFEQAARVAIDGDMPCNSAGWLNRFHPDFTLQAVPPEDNLLDKVKATLRSEPTPHQQTTDGDTSERWVDISSVVIADTTANTVNRITYRRLVKPKMPAEKGSSSANYGGGVYSGVLLTPSTLPYETHVEEEWIEEPVLHFDETIAEAVEKVMHQSPDTSKEGSAASSQAPNEIRPYAGSESSSIAETVAGDAPHATDHLVHVPRAQCKAVVLSALEDTVRDALDRQDSSNRTNSKKHLVAHEGHNLLLDAVRQWAAKLDAIDSVRF